MSFLEPWGRKGEEPYVRGKVEEAFPRTNFTNKEYPVRIRDARPNRQSFTLDTHGFAFCDVAPISGSIIEAIRSKDKALVEEKYYPLMVDLIKGTTGAHKVIIFDHTYRRRDATLEPGENPNGREQPATLAHVDQSALGAIRRVRKHAGEDAEKLLQGRAQIINIWRPINETVEDWPLALMDYRSINDSDVHPTSIFKERYDLQGQTVSIGYSESQNWYFIDQQKISEATFIKIWDSEDGVAKLCPHGSFPDPRAPVEAVPRESVEVRCLVFY